MKILVKLDKIMYGFKEAAYWWNVTLTIVFLEKGCKQMSKDKSVFVKSESNQISYCAIIVDDLMNSEPLRLVSSSGRLVRLACRMPNS